MTSFTTENGVYRELTPEEEVGYEKLNWIPMYDGTSPDDVRAKEILGNIMTASSRAVMILSIEQPKEYDFRFEVRQPNPFLSFIQMDINLGKRWTYVRIHKKYYQYVDFELVIRTMKFKISRNKLGLTQRQLAKKMGVSGRTILNWEKSGVSKCGYMALCWIGRSLEATHTK